MGTKCSRWRPPNNRRQFVLWNTQRQRPLLLPLHRQPLSMSCVCQRLMEFLSGGSTSNSRRKLRWTVITDVFAYSTAQNAFCCLVGAILNILCPRERRVFQSKLGVSSSNQCNLHHSPHTGHLGKKIKKGTIFFGHGVQARSFVRSIQKRHPNWTLFYRRCKMPHFCAKLQRVAHSSGVKRSWRVSVM